jgi:hypothetical protein
MSSEICGAYLVGKHPYTFRCGESALITGVKMMKPERKSGGYYDPRPVYEITFDDGMVDYAPISDVEVGVYEIRDKKN